MTGSGPPVTGFFYLSKIAFSCYYGFMDIDYLKLAELTPGEKPYKGYHIPLEKGYIRIMSSKLDKEGMVVAINYYGKVDREGKVYELNPVTDKKQTVKEFEDDLKRFKDMIEQSGLHMFIEDL
jgi:hypothetical protein